MNKKILAAVFTDNMVLQRQKPVKLFGNVPAGAEVEITFNNQKVKASADGEGNWQAELSPMEAAEGLTLTAQCGGCSVTLSNIAIGEVWLAGGQSNMEFPLSDCTDWDRVSRSPHPNVRFFYTPKFPYVCDEYYEAFDKACWQLSDDKEFGTWSAVGYLFAEKLADDLGVTIGIIGCNWGGTSASCWMSREAITVDEQTRIYMDEFDERNKDIPLEQQRKDYDEYVVYDAAWNERSQKLFSEQPDMDWFEAQKIIGECKWPGPINNFNPFRPTGQYLQMIRKICPYTLKGFIYYQGENDDIRPRMYDRLLTNLIRLWRKDWGDEELTFIITQLPMHRYSGSPDFKNWPILREAQMNVFDSLDNTGIAVIPDCGQFSEIHPVNKGPVGYRLALQAEFKPYGIIDEDAAFGPIFDHKEIRGNVLETFFKHCKGGLVLKGEPEYYEIAGADKIFYPADIKVKPSSIEFSSDKVNTPVYARYCWSNYCTPTLFGSNGLAASPFRTDMDDELDTNIGADVMQQNLEI